MLVILLQCLVLFSRLSTNGYVRPGYIAVTQLSQRKNKNEYANETANGKPEAWGMFNQIRNSGKMLNSILTDFFLIYSATSLNTNVVNPLLRLLILGDRDDYQVRNELT